MQVPKFLSDLVKDIESRESATAFDILESSDIDPVDPTEKIIGILPESCLGIMLVHFEKVNQYKALKLRHANPPEDHPCQEWKREEKSLANQVTMLNGLLWFSVCNEFPGINKRSFGLRKNERNEIIVVSGTITPEMISLGQLMTMMAQTQES